MTALTLPIGYTTTAGEVTTHTVYTTPTNTPTNTTTMTTTTTTTTTTDNNPLLDEYDLDLIKEGFDKVCELFVLDVAAEVPDIADQDLSEHEVEQLQDRADELQDRADELQDRADELNHAIEEVERIREELMGAYEELLDLIG